MTTTLTCKRPLLGFIFLSSLAANVFMGGMLAGRHMVMPVAAGDGLRFMASAFETLSPESRSAAMAAAEKDWPDVQARLQDLHGKRDAVKNMLAEPVYQQAELDHAFADVRQSADALIASGQKLVSDVAGKVTPEERRKLVSLLPRPPQGK